MANSKRGRDRRELKVGRVIVNLDREDYEFVDRIGRDALFTTGKRLTNNKILETFVSVMRDIMRELDIDGKGLYSKEGLKKRILVMLGINKDRRKYPRFKKEVKILWRKLDSMKGYEGVETTDISEGGFRIRLDKEHNVGEFIEFTIMDPNEPSNPIRAFGSVVWIRKREDNKGIDAGMRLNYVPEKDRSRFKSLFDESSAIFLRSHQSN